MARSSFRIVLGAVLLFAAARPSAAQIAGPPVYNPANGHWYQAVRSAGLPTWHEARAAAQSQSYAGFPGHLVTITSAAENQFVVAAVIPMLPGLNRWWIGAVQDRLAPDYREPLSGWRWINGEYWSFAAWAGGEPNNSGGAENVAEIRNDGTWNDEGEFSRVGGYIVEYEPAPPFGTGILQLFPSQVVGGTTLNAQVTLLAPAGYGGVVLSLLSSNPATAAVPAAVTVPQGATAVVFPVVTFPVAIPTPVTITAIESRLSGVLASATLQVLPGTPVTPSGNLLLNGSFEQPDVPSNADLRPLRRSDELLGWRISAGSVDLVPSRTWQSAPGEGRQALDLVGDSPGSIEQTFPTVPGQEYLLSGWIAHNPTNPRPEGRANLFLNGRFFTQLFHYDPLATGSDMRWQRFVYRFRAEAVTTTLTLVDVSQLWHLGGLALDGLTVVPVGEPFPTPTPGTPAGLTARPVVSAQIELSWFDTSADELAFEIHRRTSAGDWVWIALVAPNTTRFTDYGVVPGAVYSYRVRTQNARGVSAWSNEVSVAAP